VEGESTILLEKVWRMRKSETMRAASRLLLSHPIVCLLAALAGAVAVLGVLGPIKVVHATDVEPVEAENFDNKPTGTIRLARPRGRCERSLVRRSALRLPAR
jgi:hypothetical protein